MRSLENLFRLGLVALASCAFACGDSGDDGNTDPGVPQTLSVAPNRLSDLGADFEYEAWLVVGERLVSAGRFEADGSPIELTVNSKDVAETTAVFISIEPEPDDAPAPSSSKLLAGNLSGGTASLTVGHELAIGDDFSTASGTYLLDTPTTDSDPNDYQQGIYFLDAEGIGEKPSLNIPALEAGFVYEGWVTGSNGLPVSLGRFADPAAADSDGAGPTAGSDPAPAYPGQEFITQPILLDSSYSVQITLEPEPDPERAPSTITILEDKTIETTDRAVSESLANVAQANLPSASITIK